MIRSDHQKDFSEAVIRQFLFAQLSASDQSAFERSLFIDPELESRVRLAEIELSDDYVFGRLRFFEAKQFEKHFLCSTERAKLLTASRAFCARYAGLATPAIAPPLSAIQFRLQQRKVKFAFVVIVTALLLGTFWLVIKNDPQIRREITRRFMPKRTAAQPTPIEIHHPTNTSGPQHRETPPPLPEHDAVKPRALTIALQPNSRETAALISSAVDGNDSINFELSTNQALVGQYAVEIVTAQGQSVYSGTGQLGSASVVRFTLPKALLQPGEFEIRLTDERSNGKATT